jgi:hypothetical protein
MGCGASLRVLPSAVRVLVGRPRQDTTGVVSIVIESRAITLSISRIGSDADPGYRLATLIDGEAIAVERDLSAADSRRVRSLGPTFGDIVDREPRAEEVTARVEAVGAALFDLWLAPDWERIEQGVPAGARRLVVVASNVPEILNLPWEVMRLPGGAVLGLAPRFAVRRLPAAEGVLRPFARVLPARPLRILFVACAPTDQVALDYEREEESLYRAIADTGADAVVDTGDLGTFEELRQRVIAFRPHVVHLTGHGFAKGDGLGYLAFEDEGGQSDLRSSREIRQVLAGRGVQAVFVSACQSGMPRRGSQPAVSARVW